MIARLWLDKARKRRAFTETYSRLDVGAKKDACDLTGSTEAMGAEIGLYVSYERQAGQERD